MILNMLYTVKMKTTESKATFYFVFPALECLDFPTKDTATYTQHVFETEEQFCFKASFLLSFKISFNEIH